ncbi:hypothetical protein PUNSTDRAFT_131524 [Punctularia strigosozonata HHB-11173 SS5]|uniref:uncharacterized protein n=1 Tax=Punctularia strigosozonata (strain HHB-11173) TaxID=741275 RepID=UPI0004417CF4|nr:uncharacterized protein PUNSTDRAFT_131524 [Punctularia strigosozonata HHB-11173 SS5]EIN11362.1 hypothetical protein PUNSTDRAFT_131524 [Punctularia strigosozonata HHB-11173 SS5]
MDSRTRAFWTPVVLSNTVLAASFPRSPDKGRGRDGNGNGGGGGDGDGHGDGDGEQGGIPSDAAQPTQSPDSGDEPEPGDPDHTDPGTVLPDASLTATSLVTSNTSVVSPAANNLAVAHSFSTSEAVTIAVGIIVLLLLAFFGFFLWKRHQWHRKEWARRRAALGYRYRSRSRTPSPPGLGTSSPPPRSYRSGGRPRALNSTMTTACGRGYIIV